MQGNKRKEWVTVCQCEIKRQTRIFERDGYVRLSV